MATGGDKRGEADRHQAKGRAADQTSAGAEGDQAEATVELENDYGGTAAVPELDSRVRAQLGRHLSSYYGSLVNEPVPDKIVELLNRLGAKERGE